ncbi:ectonucleotide pyrophosphatase/phosphodiesterase family member 5 [Elysia marginata]|uniref:Ectonucleotide pyrophosphatase/phosphodiesterase family member 5 n=1 Tax=Elysia marginata TaxID=1093978 RepID=A0AAV4FNX0_9GAST|nr:ectonucleotide pyrophosphatase/phosphodiesterase family member 5 [Elysia marginata]
MKALKATTSTWVILALVLCTVQNGDTAPSATGGKPKVILVSMDGFRHDYLQLAENTPNFDRMLREGVTMPWIRNTFTTLTFPCHFTMVTGLYEESHGIISNNMYNEEMDNRYFRMSTTDDEWWTGHETIWTSAQKAGLKAGVYFWVGSASEIQGTRPEKWFRYDGSVPFEDRVDTLVKWMSEDDFDLGLLYFNEPDHTGHLHGPKGNETLHEVERMDGILGRLLDKLNQTDLLDKVNLIVTSDHGMAEVDSDKKTIDLRDYVNDTLIRKVVQQGAIAHLIPQEGKTQELVDALKDVEHMRVFVKEDMPERFHYKNHRRIQPVVLVADEGWGISQNATYRRLNIPRFLGDHGYDNILNSMRPIFAARGPAFKQNAIVESIDTVDIYPLICHILNIDPAPNNGSLERAAALLRVPPKPHDHPSSPTRCISDFSTKPDACSSTLAILFVISSLMKWNAVY